MYCTRCGAGKGAHDHFCSQCGAPFDATAPATPATAVVRAGESDPAIAEAGAVPADQVRPWVRYWARMIDLYLFVFTLGMLVELKNPGLLDSPGSEQGITLLGLLGWVFTEAGLLSTFGTTPGKALLNIRLVPPSLEGDRAPYATALTRSLRVWWRGLGAGIPLVTLVTLLVAHRKLRRNGASSWDIDGGWRTVHRPVGFVRAAAACLILLGMFALALYGGSVDARISG